jgi:hypothetical protein
MTSIQDPLVSAEVDLRDFGFMPLDVLRLRDSDLMALSTGEEFKAAVSLWCVAWHQIPAGSLPNDDRLLARFSGAGSAWKKVKEGALRGFVECSDGRLYHTTIAGKAQEAWGSKLAQRARTAAATAAREAKRRAQQSGTNGEREQQRDVVRDVKRDEQREQTTDVHQGTWIVKGQGQGDLLLLPSEDDPAPPQSAGPEPEPPPPFDGENAEALNGKAIVTLAAAWELPEEWGLDAERLGWKPAEVIRQSERFRQYWTQGRGQGTRRSVKGWRQTWSNWLEKAAKDAR